MGIQVFVEGGFGHCDTADHGKILDEGAAFHQFFETTVEVADVGFAVDDGVTVED